MTVKLHVGFVGTCNLYGRQGSTQWCILQHDQTQPRTKAQRASKHSLGKNWLSAKAECKHAKNRIKQKAQNTCLVRGFRKAVRIFIKWGRITSYHSCAGRYDVRRLTMEKATGPHVSKLFWAPLHYAAGIRTGVIRRGLLWAVMVNSKWVSRCPWESRWTATEGLSRVSVKLSPWERLLRTTHQCVQH